jgi:hypothetical protein
VNLTDRVRETLDLLKPRLIDLADGYAEFAEVDETPGIVKLWLVDGRLH